MQIGRYELIRSLGEGGSAKVLLAKSINSGQQVVLKVPLQATPDKLERMRDEARVGLRLQHPNIVETLDLFEHEGKPVLVVEYVDGASLQQIRKVGPLSPAAVVRVGRQIAEALDTIHTATDESGSRLNMLHRDVTPGNILITRQGDAKLIDLGIARSVETQARATQAGAVRGTLRYLAPELIEGEKHSAATDLWALGVALWEGVLGRRAVLGDDRVILTSILRGDVMKYQPGEALDPRLHDALAAFIAPKDARLQKAKAAGNILGRLEQAFGDGQTPAQAAVDMTIRLLPTDGIEAVGDNTQEVLAAAPQPASLPPSTPVSEPSPPPASPNPETQGAKTRLMPATDAPYPSASRAADPPQGAVAPLASADLSDGINGRYTATEQAMPAVTSPHAPRLPSSPNEPANLPGSEVSPQLAAVASAAPVTSVDPLSVNVPTEGTQRATVDAPQAETPSGSASLKSTQALYSGAGLPSLGKQTSDVSGAAATPEMASAASDAALSQDPLPSIPAPSAASAQVGPTGTAINMSAAELSIPETPAAADAEHALNQTASDPPPPTAAASAKAQPADQGGNRVPASATANTSPVDEVAKEQPQNKEHGAPPPQDAPPSVSTSPAPSTEDAAEGPFGMTVTQAFFTTDIQDALKTENAEPDVEALRSSTGEMEAAIAPVEGKLAALIGGAALLVILVGVGIYSLWGSEESKEDAPVAAAASSDAGVRDAGVKTGATAKQMEATQPSKKKRKKKRARKRKRRRKRKR